MENLSIKADDETEDDIKALMGGSQLTILESNGQMKVWRVWLSKCSTKIHLVPKFKTKEKIKKTIEIVDIVEVRFGFKTDAFHRIRNDQGRFDGTEIQKLEKCCFSIHHGVDVGLSILADDEITCARWRSGLLKLANDNKEAFQRNRCDPNYWLTRLFREEDTDNAGYLSAEKCKAILVERLNVVLEDKLLEEYFEKADTNKEFIEGESGLELEEFKLFYQLVTHRPALAKIFEEVAGENETIDANSLLNFLTQVQGEEGLDVEQVRNMILTYEGEQMNESMDDVRMTLKGFRSMMVSDQFDIRLKKYHRVNQPMDRPLSHYWIKSSHNTYLVAGQVVGDSSIEGYRRALKRNFACIEMDLWDGEDSTPVIRHGKTVVTTITARDVLVDGLLPFIFFHDEYPIIISIEDHMTPLVRETFIHDFRTIMKDHIYCVNLEDLNGDGFLPSPEQLKRKVIVKAAHSLWKELTNICQAVPFPKNALDTADKQPCYNVSSLSEYEINRLIQPSILNSILFKTQETETYVKKVREYTVRHLLRVYPGAHRQLSGNYDTTASMNAGCQLVALNVQTKSSEMAIYEGKFRSNGDCGYTLKPECLINPLKPRTVPSKKLTITIISGQNIPHGEQTRAVSNPFVCVRIAGEPCDDRESKTKAVNGNGLNPVWDSTFTFDVKFPELAVILFQVKHTETLTYRTLGSFAVPVTTLGIGYRHVPLQDVNLEQIPLATLFVKVAIESI